MTKKKINRATQNLKNFNERKKLLREMDKASPSEIIELINSDRLKKIIEYDEGNAQDIFDNLVYSNYGVTQFYAKYYSLIEVVSGQMEALIEKGNISFIKEFIKVNRYDKQLFSKAKTGHLGHYIGTAVRTGSLELVKLLHEYGAEIDTAFFYTPLARAEAYPDIVDFLLDNGADVNWQSQWGESVLYLYLKSNETLIGSVFSIIEHPDYKPTEKEIEFLSKSSHPNLSFILKKILALL